MQWNQKIDGTLDVANLLGMDFNDVQGPKYSTPFYYLGYNAGVQGNLGHLKSGLNWNEGQGLTVNEAPHHGEIDSVQIRELLDNHIIKLRIY